MIMMGVPFVPRYELAVWTASVLQPDLFGYFPDKHSAMEGFAKVEAAIKQDGRIEYIRRGGFVRGDRPVAMLETRTCFL